MSSYQYRKSHCGDKTVVRSSYLHNGVSYTGKMTSLYWIRALLFMMSNISQDAMLISIGNFCTLIVLQISLFLLTHFSVISNPNICNHEEICCATEVLLPSTRIGNNTGLNNGPMHIHWSPACLPEHALPKLPQDYNLQSNYNKLFNQIPMHTLVLCPELLSMGKTP